MTWLAYTPKANGADEVQAQTTPFMALPQLPAVPQQRQPAPTPVAEAPPPDPVFFVAFVPTE